MLNINTASEMNATEHWHQVVQKNATNIGTVPYEFLTPELCRQAVQKTAFALYYIPEHMRTAELCRLAVQKDSMCIDDVPSYRLTAELCRLAVEGGYQVRNLPKRFQTAELRAIAANRKVG